MLEVQDDSFGVVGFWWELSSCLVHVCLFAEFLTWWEAKEERERASTRGKALWSPFRDSNLIRRSPPSWSLLKLITDLQSGYEFWGNTFQSIASSEVEVSGSSYPVGIALSQWLSWHVGVVPSWNCSIDWFFVESQKQFLYL